MELQHTALHTKNTHKNLGKAVVFAAKSCCFDTKRIIGNSTFLGIESILHEDRPWCSKVIPNFSAMYMFIQKEYWGVGLFAYYEIKQVYRTSIR